MPSRHSAGLRIIAATLLTLYVAPALLPGLSGLSHGAFHAIAEPVAAVPDGSHSHHHPHSHDGGPAHTHIELVDTLLTVLLTDEVLDDAHTPAPESTGPGLHLPESGAHVETVNAGSSPPHADIASTPADLAPLLPTPPPRA